MSRDHLIGEPPLIAILRGITPEEAISVGEVLVAAGFRSMEVPLNSPRAFESIALLQQTFGSEVLVGAGTVLTPADVDAVAAAGGKIIVSPDTRPDVIRATKRRGLLSLPAFLTPGEAFAAIEAGADGLKLFPAEVAGPALLKAVRTVLPVGTSIFPSGGVSEPNLRDWMLAGAAGFGLGSNLYTPGRSPTEVAERARSLIRTWYQASEERHEV